MIKIKNKKAAIGATLTWIVATFIIFFILLIFVLLTLVISKSKDKPMISEITAANEKLALTENLISFLNMPAESDNKIQIKDLIIESKNTELEKEFKNFINKLEPKPECYIFRVERDGKTDFEVYDAWDVPVIGGQRRGKPQVESILKKTIELNLTSKDNKPIRVRFYAGGCGK